MATDIWPYTVQLLCDVPNLADDCCVLINQEWKRSHQARLRSLNKSNDRFPINFILIREEKGNAMVVGHCRASKIKPPDNNGPSAFLETVVIAPELRGKGLGRYLMTKSEHLLSERGIQNAYLSTMDKAEFYRKLGYITCKPVDTFARVPYLSTPIPQDPPPLIGYWAKQSIPPPPPPPPPPLPLPPPRLPSADDNAINGTFCEGTKIFMRKVLTPSK